MASFTTTKELTEALKRLYIEPDDASKKPLRYVIYARKSTDEKDKQVRSLGDQITECMDYADRHSLLLGRPAVVQEARSAKQSDKREQFRVMLEDIKKGKYDGILAWHPDRLARNLKDAGEIVDLLDKGIIKDLKFVSFNFENTPSGLMHLGITFVIAKQYSDQLSANVSRGIGHSIEEGYHINRPKHGYFKDSEQRLRADGRNYELLKHAFVLRLENKTLDEIAAYLNQNHYERAYVDGSHKPFKWNKERVRRTLNDPVYAGVVAYGEGNIADLTELYDFEPLVSVEDFMRIKERRLLLNTLKGKEKALATKEVRLKEFVLDEKDPRFIEGFKQDLLKVRGEQADVAADIGKLERVIASAKSAVVLMPEFLELMEKITQLIASTPTMAELDFCVRKMFSNFSVRGKNVEWATLSEPFARIVDPKVALGARCRT